MLDRFVFIFIVTALPVLAFAIFLLVRVVLGVRIGSSRLSTYAVNGGAVIATFIWVLTSLQLFKGNFLAPLAGILFGVAAGGVAAIAIIVVGALIASIYIFFSREREVEQKSHAEYSDSSCLLLFATVYLLFGYWVVSEISAFHKEYGKITEKPLPLTESQIRAAYGRWVVRHHNGLLRVLLRSPEIPFKLIEEIYDETTDYHVLYAVLTHPNTSCEFLSSYLADPKEPVPFLSRYSSRQFSSRDSGLTAVAARIFNDRRC